MMVSGDVILLLLYNKVNTTIVCKATQDHIGLKTGHFIVLKYYIYIIVYYYHALVLLLVRCWLFLFIFLSTIWKKESHGRPADF